MDVTKIWIPGQTPVLYQAARHLIQRGCEISRFPDGAACLLLSVPVRADIPSGIPPGIPVFGGALSQSILPCNPVYDFLKDDAFLYCNAAITADCALRFAGQCLPVTWSGCPVLIIGFGRIGKFLIRSLNALGADVTVALRNPEARAFLNASGCCTIHTDAIGPDISHYRVIFNTVPVMIIPREIADQCADNAILLDLASIPGMEGPQVIPARGLPGKLAPESAGILIADTLLRCIRQEEDLP